MQIYWLALMPRSMWFRQSVSKEQLQCNSPGCVDCCLTVVNALRPQAPAAVGFSGLQVVELDKCRKRLGPNDGVAHETQAVLTCKCEPDCHISVTWPIFNELLESGTDFAM